MNSVAVLRVCSFPIQSFLASGRPRLFALCGDWDASSVHARAEAAATAATINSFLNANNISRADSKLLGSVASRLSRGAELRDRELQIVDDVVARYNAELAHRIRSAEAAMRSACQQERILLTKLETEGARSAAILFDQCRTRPEILAVLRQRNLEFLKGCLAEGSHPKYWTNKEGRRRALYLIRILSRATFRTVPRDWYTYITVLPIARAGEPETGPASEGRFAEIWTENIHSQRRKLAEEWSAESDASLSLPPLQWATAGRICFYVTDRDNPTRVQEIDLKLSPFLKVIMAALDGTALTFAYLSARIGPLLTREESEILEPFVRHLIDLGVVVVSRAPRAHTRSWYSPSPYLDVCAKGHRMSEGYLDVFGKWSGAVPGSIALQLQRSFCVLARLAVFVDESAHKHSASLGVDVGSKTPVLKAFKEEILASDKESNSEARFNQAVAQAAPKEWPEPLEQNSPYAKLMDKIRAQLGSRQRIVIANADLNEVGAPGWHYRWPCDAMIRMPGPGSDYCGVFDEAFPAGSMDSRLVDAARTLGFPVPQYDRYRLFLSELSRRHGHSFVELLVPPLSLGAANAIRRPPYVPKWTGDPDMASYYTSMTDGCEFIRLEDLSICETARGRRVLLYDQPVFPMYHATRLPIPPWNTLIDLMLNAAPFQMRWAPRRLHRLLDAFPEVEHAPRLEVEGGLVVSCAQWRLPKELPWRHTDPPIEKMRALCRWRNRLNLPRIVFLSSGPARRPAPCDLDNIECFRTIEDVYERAIDPIAIAMTPNVSSFLLKSKDSTGFNEVASCTMLRFPLDEEPMEMALRVGAALQ